MEIDKMMFFLFMIIPMLSADGSTYYPKSFISLGGVAAQDPEASASGTTNYNVINGARGTINDNGPDNVVNGDNTVSQELPPQMSAPAPSTIVPAELPPPTSVSTPSNVVPSELPPPTAVSTPSNVVPAELPPPTSVSTPPNVVPVYGGRYGFPWLPIEVLESKHGDSQSASKQAAVKKQP